MESSLLQGAMSMSDINVKPMKVRALVEHALNGTNHDRLEIRVSNMLMITRRIAPNFVLKQLRKPVDRVCGTPPGSTRSRQKRVTSCLGSHPNGPSSRPPSQWHR